MRRILFTVGTVAATLAISGCAAGVYRTNPTAESSTDPGGDRIVVTGNGVQRSIDCTGRDAEVDGNALQVVLNGTCPTVRVSGHGNQVDIGTVGTIAITGSGNKVHWVAARSGAQPSVEDTGDGNDVGRGTGAATTDTGKQPAPTPSEPTGNQGNTITGKYLTRTIACAGGDYLVTAMQSHIIFTGQCATVEVRGLQDTVEVANATKVSVTGLQSTIVVGHADWISVTGTQDVVRYHSGNPRIDNTGDDSTVKQG